jgi:hypothetical protein
MDRIPVLYVKREEALAEDLCLVVRLDTQSLSRVERSETLLQCMRDIFVHGTTSSEIGSTFHGSTRPCQTLQSTFRPTAWEHEVLEDFPAFLINLLGVVEIRYELDVAFGSISEVGARSREVCFASHERTSSAWPCMSERCPNADVMTFCP